MFHACDTQWRYSSQGVRLGLDYGAVESVLRLRESNNARQVFRAVQVMEAEVLQVEVEKHGNTD